MSKKKFDSKGNLIYYRKGHKKSIWKYDEYNRLIYSKEPGEHTQVWRYDSSGNTILHKKGHNYEVWEYDEDNALLHYEYGYKFLLNRFTRKIEWYKYDNSDKQEKITEKEFLEIEYSTKPIAPKDIKKRKLFFGNDIMVAVTMVVIFMVIIAGIHMINVYTIPQRQVKFEEGTPTFLPLTEKECKLENCNLHRKEKERLLERQKSLLKKACERHCDLCKKTIRKAEANLKEINKKCNNCHDHK